MTALVTTLLFTSCLFDSRDAQPPNTGGTGGCILDSPERAFFCMKQALASQQSGDYERSISENFVFSPTVADSLDQAFTGVPVYDGWNKDVEMQTLNLLLDDTNFTQVDFGTPSRLINKNTFVRWNVSYSLKTVTTAAPTDTVIYKGVAHIDVKNENGNWRVTFWDEAETVAGFSTWGFLRGIQRLRLSP
jgi:hypothetical protein